MRKEHFTEQEIEEFSDSYLEGFLIQVQDDMANELLDKLQKFTGVYGSLVEKHGNLYVKAQS